MYYVARNWRAPFNNMLKRLNMFHQNILQSVMWFHMHMFDILKQLVLHNQCHHYICMVVPLATFYFDALNKKMFTQNVFLAHKTLFHGALQLLFSIFWNNMCVTWLEFSLDYASFLVLWYRFFFFSSLKRKPSLIYFKSSIYFCLRFRKRQIWFTNGWLVLVMEK